MTAKPQHAFSRITVARVLRSRYAPGTRPALWSERKPGLEEIITEEGEEVVLASDGGQSSPAPGWNLMLLPPENGGEENIPAFPWTLYGLRRRG